MEDGNAMSEQPLHIHQPFISLEREGIQNTDPFIFGDCFVYSNCLQSLRRMRSLPDGTLILFGSEIPINGQDAFVLDTVFVVRDSMPFDRQHLAEIENRTSNVFTDAVLRKIVGRIQNGLRVYFSVAYQPDTKEFYSYFPCQPYAPDTRMLRPVLPFHEFDLKRPGSHQGFKIVERGCLQYWRLLTERLLDNGYSLGVRADLPGTIDIAATYGQHFA